VITSEPLDRGPKVSPRRSSEGRWISSSSRSRSIRRSVWRTLTGRVCRRFESCGAPNFRLASDIIRYTRTLPPPLLPLFRSEHQLRLLGELFVYSGEARSISELAATTGIPQATVSREVARLEEAGLVESVRRGRLRLVEPDEQLPYYHELRSLLLKTIGPAAVLTHELSDVPGIDKAFVYGSWAARYHGERGASPRDIDLLVIGEPELDALYAACRRVEKELRLDVNPVVRSRAEWQRRGSSFLADVRKGPLVTVVGAR